MIKIKDLYEKANSVTGMSQKEFLTYVNEALLQLNARYGDGFVYEDKEVEVESVDSEVAVHKEWRSAILHYVIYLKNGDAVRKAEFDSSLDYSYRTIWKRLKGDKMHYRVPNWI